MSRLPLSRRMLAVAGVVLPLLALFIFVALRSGPLAPVAVTVATVEAQALTPALFGIGTVEAGASYRIGPTVPGRVRQLHVQVGDRVRAGQVLGAMDPVDLDERVQAHEAGFRRAQAVLREAEARQAHAAAQARRYEQLAASRLVSEEAVSVRRQDLQVADAALAAAREEVSRMRADRAAGSALQRHQRLAAPVDGVVAVRAVEPGTTVVAGQSVVEVFDPHSIWVNARFDQASAQGLAPALPADIRLRSRRSEALPGRVLRLEPRADAITEELLAKVSFEAMPQPLPPLGELAEVTVSLPALAAAPVVPNAALRRSEAGPGVWRLRQGGLEFVPVRLGAADLEGHVQVLEGLSAGDRIVVYSEKALAAGSRIRVVERLPGVPQ